MSKKTNWIGVSEVAQFDGALVVTNLDIKDKIPQPYLFQVAEEVSKAYASGLLVAYLFDQTKGICQLPDELERMDGSSLLSLSVPFGVNTFKFSLDPQERINAYKTLAKGIYENIEGLQCRAGFANRDFRFIGKANLGGDSVLMPLFNLPRK